MYANLALIVTGYPPSILGLYQAPRDFVNKWLYNKPEAASGRFIEYCESKRREIRYPLYSFLSACAKICLKFYIFLFKLVAALNDSRWVNLIFCLAWFGLGLASIFEDRNIPQWDMDGTENAMTFGQIVPILVLSSTLFVAREAYDGRVTLGNASQCS